MFSPAEADVDSTVKETAFFGQESFFHPLFPVFGYQFPVGMIPVFRPFRFVCAIVHIPHRHEAIIAAIFLKNGMPFAKRAPGIQIFADEVVRSPMVGRFQGFDFFHL